MSASSVILAIDTSLGSCSVALWQGDGVTASIHEDKSSQQSRNLLPMIEAVLAERGAAYADMDAIACTIGPGGFTGIRVGLTTARALRLATGKPLIGLTTLEVIASSAKLTGDILAIIDAYRGQYYVQRFRMIEHLTPLSDALLVYENILPALAHGANRVQTIPKAGDVAALAYAKWQAGEREFPDSPLYIREPDAKLPAAS